MRKIQDFYFKKAKEESYLARSVYKLEEIDRKHSILKKGMAVLDIGCAPGSWSQYILKKIGSGSLVGVDLKHKVPIRDPRFRYLRGDIFELGPDQIIAGGAVSKGAAPSAPEAGRQRFDLITSDAAPDTSGNMLVDSQRSLAIVRRVFELASHLLTHRGTVVAKVFQGEDLKGFVDAIRRKYSRVALFKPQSSRKESKELFIIAIERRPKDD